MPTLVPVDNDPFAASSAPRQGAPKLVPVDNDPFVPPPAPPETTAGGIAGSITRGIGPYAAGALAGAALGAPLGGVGAIPGAMAGAGAVGLEELTSAVWDPIAKVFRLPTLPTARDLTDKALDFIGERRPSTPTERMIESGAGGAAGAFTGAGVAKQVAENIVPRTVATTSAKALAGQLAKKPALQALSGLTGGVSGQAAAELGLGPAAQSAAAMLGGSLPYGMSGLRGTVRADPRPVAQEAHRAGYVLPPAMASEKPGAVSRTLSGWSGKIKLQQAASDQNQAVTNRLAAASLELPPDTPLTDQAFTKVRSDAGKAYEAVTNAVPAIKADADYDHAISQLGGHNSQAAQHFSGIVNNTGIAGLKNELQNVKQFPTAAGVQLVKQLRFEGNANLKAIGDPEKHALGLAQRQAADAVDDLMDRNITASGKPDVIAKYRKARTTIAKSYDLEGATNTATGDVNARGLARLADKGRPLQDELRVIANTAAAFPKAVQVPAGFGDVEPYSVLDFFGGLTAAAHGNPGILAAVAGRPLARAAVLSKPYQGAMMTPRKPGTPPPLPLLTNAGALGIVPPSQSAANALGVGQ